MSLKVVDQITDYLKVAIPDLFNPVTQLIYRICKVTSAGEWEYNKRKSNRTK